jgi:hypothetical protein
MYDLVNTSHEIFDLAKTWIRSHEIRDATGFNLGYCFLGTTFSVSRLLHEHYLPADRADSLVDTTDRCKSKTPDSRSLAKDLSAVAFLTLSVVVVWVDDGLVTKDRVILHP